MIVSEELKLESANGQNQLYTKIWYKKSDEAYRGIVQILHGMIEHIGRYEETAEYLAEAGYIVVGHDHLGHGKTAADESELGYFPGKKVSRIVVDDAYCVTSEIKKRYPGLPFFLLGHSMGSLILRRYMMTYGEEADGALILGTGRIKRSFLFFGNLFVKMLMWLKGEEYHSPLIEILLFGAYNDRFSSNRFGKDWLTKDKTALEKYTGDSFCQFTFSLSGIQVLIDTVRFIQKKSNMRKIPKDLPIIFMAGTEDPFGEYGRGVNEIYSEYKKLGLNDVRIQMYDNDRHELLQETDKEAVWKNIKQWLDNYCGNK